MWLDFIQQHWLVLPWICTLVWVHFRLKKQQSQIEERLHNSEKKLDAALEKLDVGIFEVKNRTRCKMLDRDARR